MANLMKNLKDKAPLVASVSIKGMVIVEVGPNKIKHYVHNALLVHHSEHFRRALSGTWEEAKEGVVTLEGIEPATFTLFVHWLYTQQIPSTYEAWEEPLLPKLGNNQGSEWLLEYVKSWVFGNQFLAPEFAHALNNSITTILSYYSADKAGRTATRYAFANLLPSYTLRQALIDHYCDFWDDDSNDYSLAAQYELPRSFLRRAMKRLHELSTMSDEEKENEKERCYSEHISGEEKKACEGLHMRYNKKADLAYFE